MNLAQKREYTRAWWAKNKERMRQWKKSYYAKQKEILDVPVREWIQIFNEITVEPLVKAERERMLRRR